MTDIFNGFGIEVELIGDSRITFNRIRDVLSRIGVMSTLKKEMWQSCHILHKRGHYSIMHFKELYGFDGRECTTTPEDLKRRNKIVGMLVSWGLIKPVDTDKIADNDAYVAILSREEAKGFRLNQKYNIGKRG